MAAENWRARQDLNALLVLLHFVGDVPQLVESCEPYGHP
jgi:hypothetical protein